jgi:hypothetical protein
MAFVINVKAGGLPVGVYPAEFIRAEHYETEDRPDLPPAIKLVWRVLAGKHAEEEAWRIVSTKTGPKANLPKFLKGFLGRDVAAGEQIDLESFYGLRASIVVEVVEGGGTTRVATFLRETAPEEPTAESPANESATF